ncbi:MAG TPA: helix-turn-helix transcriptional regulator [Thermoanaerobaculia bacterium]|nr:helix-turn-helix transcriptional regulator [Thermoanaerobaculia bacterium]
MTDEQFLRAFGERIRGERARRGMSRKLLADHAGISERYLTQLESGKGNVSIVLLRHIAEALNLPLTRLVEDAPPSPELELVRQFLSRLTPAQLREVYESLTAKEGSVSRNQRIALVGLRGAGKTTLGAKTAEALDLPFFELDREIERIAGTALGSILELYGQQAYRRYELQALQELLAAQPRLVVATGGSLVSETATYELLLRSCFTVWVRTTPEEHMRRVLAQGDLRPMANVGRASARPVGLKPDLRPAMDDLRRILEERSELYARADIQIDTSGKSVTKSVRELLKALPEL